MCHLRKLLQNLVFEAVLFTTQIKNLHETKKTISKMFSRNIENTYIGTFRQKSSDINNFLSVFRYFLLIFRKLDRKKHSYQISAQMNNI